MEKGPCGIGSKEKFSKYEAGMYQCWQVPSLHYLNEGVQVLMTQTNTPLDRIYTRLELWN